MTAMVYTSHIILEYVQTIKIQCRTERKNSHLFYKLIVNCLNF